MKLVIGETGIETIVEPWMPPGMAALAGDEDVAFLKGGKITVMSKEDVSLIAKSAWEQSVEQITITVRPLDVSNFERRVARIISEALE